MRSFVDNVQITATSSGTGPFVLGAATAGGYRGIEALEDQAIYSYNVQQGDNFEGGYGKFLLSSGTLTRTVRYSSHGGAPVPFQSGAQIAFTLLAEDIAAILALISSAGGGSVLQILNDSGTVGDAITRLKFTGGVSLSNPSVGEVDVVINAGTAAATVDQVHAGTANDVALTPLNFLESVGVVALTYGSTVTIDGNAGFNFSLALTGNAALANPANMKPGQSGLIFVAQDATGGRALTYGTHWKFPGGPNNGGALSPAANAVDAISYFVLNSGDILATVVHAFSSTDGPAPGAFQPLDADLTAIAALTDVGKFFYRSADGVWLPVAMGSNVAFDAGTGTLSATGGGGGGGGGGGTSPADLIGTHVCVGSETTITIPVPSTFTDLAVSFQGAATAAGQMGIYFNGDTVNANYDSQRINQYGVSPSNSPCFADIGTDPTYFSSGYGLIPAYNSAHAKSYSGTLATDPNVGSLIAQYVANRWRTPAPITSITIIAPGGGTFLAGTTLSVMGLGGGSAGAATPASSVAAMRGQIQLDFVTDKMTIPGAIHDRTYNWGGLIGFAMGGQVNGPILSAVPFVVPAGKILTFIDAAASEQVWSNPSFYAAFLKNTTTATEVWHGSEGPIYDGAHWITGGMYYDGSGDTTRAVPIPLGVAGDNLAFGISSNNDGHTRSCAGWIICALVDAATGALEPITGGPSGPVAGPSGVIASHVFAAGETSITFAVPNSFTDLEFTFAGNGTQNAQTRLYYNGDTNDGNYYHVRSDKGGMISASFPYFVEVNGDADKDQVSTWSQPGYNDALKHSRTGTSSLWAASFYSWILSNMTWTGGPAVPITSVTFTIDAGTFKPGSRFTVRGK